MTSLNVHVQKRGGMNRQLMKLCLLIILVVVGCSDTTKNNMSMAMVTPSPASEESTSRPQIALVMKTLTNPFFIEMEHGAREAADEFDIELIVRTAAQETSIEQQIEIINELIQDQVDAIVIAPGDSLSLIPVLKLAQEAGITVINIDNRLDPEFSTSHGLTEVPFISVDNEQGAYLSAKYISDQIDSPTDVILLEGIREAGNAQDRQAGALRAFDENSNITVVAMETAHWKIDEGYDVTKELFMNYPEVGAVFAANDMMALGTIQYLSEANRTDVLVAGYDALSEAKQAIEAGTLAVTIDQQAARQGYLGVEYAVKALSGEELPSETMVDVLLVTKETVEE